MLLRGWFSSQTIETLEVDSVEVFPALESHNWYGTGVWLNLRAGTRVPLIRLFNLGAVVDLITYDGIDLWTDRLWAEKLAKQLSEILQVPCRIPS